MKYSILIICLFFIECTNAVHNKNTEFQKNGTLVIAAIGSDGIVIGADSRTIGGEVTRIGDSITSKRIDYYQDSSQKIFLIKNTVVATTGIITFKGGVTMSQLVQHYNRFQVDTINFRYIMGNFAKSILSQYKPDSTYNSSQFITGWYYDNKPTITVGWYTHLTKAPIIDSYHVSNPAGIPFFKKYCKYNRKLTCAQLSKMIEKAINDYGNSDKTVGGPVSIYKIDSNNKGRCLQNDFSNKPLGGKIIPISKSDTSFNRVRRGLSILE